MKPSAESLPDLPTKAADQIANGQSARHVGMVDGLEAVLVVAELAVFLLGVFEPLAEAVLVDVLDAASAEAWEEQRALRTSLRAADAADIRASLVLIRSRRHRCSLQPSPLPLRLILYTPSLLCSPGFSLRPHAPLRVGTQQAPPTSLYPVACIYTICIVHLFKKHIYSSIVLLLLLLMFCFCL